MMPSDVTCRYDPNLAGRRRQGRILFIATEKNLALLRRTLSYLVPFFLLTSTAQWFLSGVVFASDLIFLCLRLQGGRINGGIWGLLALIRRQKVGYQLIVT